MINLLHKLCILFQMIAGVHRNKGINFQKGSQWCSLTDEFVRYVLTKREWIRKTFKYTLGCDELFLYTIMINSSLRNNLYYKIFDDDILRSSMRLIDWTRGNKKGSPYIFRLSDLEMIKNSPAMFARKFHPSVDAQIIEKLKELYC